MLHTEREKIAFKDAISPGLTAAFVAYPFMSGDSSLGQAAGETLGGMAGWEMGSKLMKSALPKVPVQAGASWLKNATPTSLGKGFLRFGGTLATSILGSSILGKGLDTIVPLKRQITSPKQLPITY